MKYEAINEWSRKLLPVVAGLFLLLLVVYGWLLGSRALPEVAANFFPGLPAGGVQTYGEAGQIFGAMSAIFSAVAMVLVVLLFWRMRKDRRLQQRELRHIKSDYEINRLNNLIISQVNRIEYLIETLTFYDLEGNDYLGQYGIDFLNAFLQIKNIEKFKSGELAGKEEERLIVENYKSIKRLLLTIAQSNQTIEDQVYISNIGRVEKERLYAIYLRNLGAANLIFLRKLESFTDVIINSENTYENKEMNFDNPVFVLSELSAGFFHNIAANCESRLVHQIVPEAI